MTDEARLLDSETRAYLEGLLQELEEKTTAEVAVVTVSSLGGLDEAGYAQRLFDQWKIGKRGKDNGCLFLIAPNERRVRIHTGYGLEPILPDGLLGRLLDEGVVPEFKRGDFSKGIVRGTESLASIVARGAGARLEFLKGPAQAAAVSGLDGEFWLGLSIWILLIVIVIIVVRADRKQRKRRPRGVWTGGSFGGGGFSSGGFGGFGGGSSGGGGAGRGF